MENELKIIKQKLENSITTLEKSININENNITNSDNKFLLKRMKYIQTIFNNDTNNLLSKIINNINLKKFDNIKNNDIRILIEKNNIDFFKVINILNKNVSGKLLYITSGSNGHIFKNIYENKNKLSFCVKVVAYTKKHYINNIFDSTRSENVEILILSLLSYFVINHLTPHILLPITTFNTDIKTFINLYEKGIVINDKYKNFINKYNNNEFYNDVSILISEQANNGDLLDYLTKNCKYIKLNEWRTLFFQIISTLAIIQSKYPGFRHNDFKPNNILIDNIFITDYNKKYKYIINNINYTIPYIGYQIKIWDFDFTCIDKLIINSKVETKWANKINITSKQNRYYDIHYFFNILLKTIFLPDINNTNYLHNEVIDFVNRLIPDKYKIKENTTKYGRLLIDDEYIIPENIIKYDTFFSSFRQ